MTHAGGALHVEHCTVMEFASRGISVELASSGSVLVKETTIRNNDQGIVVFPSSGSPTITVSLDHVHSDQNATHGAYISGGIVGISNSTFSQNGGAGVWVDQGAVPSQAAIDSSVMFGNTFGIYAGTGPSTTRISNVLSTNNTYGLYLNGGTVLSFGNNHIAGNTLSNGSASSNIGAQ